MEVADQLQESAAGFKTFDAWFLHMEEYKKELAAQARSQIDGGGQDRDCISLMTMHSAKGLEFKIVFILDANEGVTPHKKAVFRSRFRRRKTYVLRGRNKGQGKTSYLFCKRAVWKKTGNVQICGGMFLWQKEVRNWV